MTALTQRKSRLVFETSDELRERGRYRQVVVEAKPTHAVLRLKGTRKSVTVTWGGIFAYAAKLEVEHERALKAAKRKGMRP